MTKSFINSTICSPVGTSFFPTFFISRNYFRKHTEKLALMIWCRVLFGGSQVSTTLFREKKNNKNNEILHKKLKKNEKKKKKKNEIRGQMCLPIPMLRNCFFFFGKDTILRNYSLLLLLRGGRKASTCFFTYTWYLTCFERVMNFLTCTWLVGNEYLLFRVLVEKYVTCKLLDLFDYLLLTSTY